MSEQPEPVPRKRRGYGWVWAVLGGLTLLIVLACGVGLYGFFQWGPELLEPDTFGQAGAASSGGPDGQFSVSTSYWQKGTRLVLAGVTEYPAKPKGPSYVVLTRLPNRMNWQAGGGSGSGGEQKLYTTTSMRDRNGAPIDVAFRLLDPGLKEQLTLGGTQFRPEEGRVFLLDLRTSPAAFKQLKADFGDLFTKPGPTTGDLKWLAGELETQNEEVRDFWQ